MVHMTLELSDGNQLLASDVFEEVEYKGVEGDAMRVSCAVWHVLRSVRCWLDDRRRCWLNVCCARLFEHAQGACEVPPAGIFLEMKRLS
jgi:hypothetical protein